MEVIKSIIMDNKGRSPNLWVATVGESHKAELTDCDESDSWTVHPKSHNGDLVLFYHKNPDGGIKDIFEITSEVNKEIAGDWTTRKYDFFAGMKRVARLSSPITFSEIKNYDALSNSQMVLMHMMGRFEVTEYWDSLYEIIVEKNPGLKKKLSKFSPEKICR